MLLDAEVNYPGRRWTQVSRPATTFKSRLKLAIKGHWYCHYETPSFTLSCLQQLRESDSEKCSHRLRMKALNTALLTLNQLWKVSNVDWVTLVWSYLLDGIIEARIDIYMHSKI
jgi:hypothetical protein